VVLSLDLLRYVSENRQNIKIEFPKRKQSYLPISLCICRESRKNAGSTTLSRNIGIIGKEHIVCECAGDRGFRHVDASAVFTKSSKMHYPPYD